jgi:hypothetical protein
MKPSTQTLIDTEVAGTAYSDLRLWMKLDDLILNTSAPIEDRAAASRKVDEIIGTPAVRAMDDATDEGRVAAHVAVLLDVGCSLNQHPF